MLFDAHSHAPVFRAVTGHLPVLLTETLEAFAPLRSRRFLDCTFGGGGHTQALLESAPDATVLALDWDPDAEKRAREAERRHAGRFRFVSMNFADLADLDESGFDGALMDIGVSSYHFDQAERGFSFRHGGPADMRMDPRRGAPVSEFLETAPREQIERALRDYGEEPRWRKAAEAICAARGTGRLARSDTLADLIAEAVGGKGRGGRPLKIHPATRAFQGLRIAINSELENLERALPAAFERLTPGGRLAVISFHSLEDRIVKRFFRRMAGRPEHGRDSAPQEERHKRAKLIGAKPVKAGAEEAKQNPRARSARLRVLEKIQCHEQASQ